MNKETSHRRAVVIGGGIGGLAAGVGLTRSGWQVVVVERAPALEPVGAGLVLWPNGVAALGALGLDDVARDAGRTLAGTGIRRASGRWLSRTDGSRLARRHGHGLLAVTRADLVDLLARALPDGVLRLGTAVTDVRPCDDDTGAEVGCGDETLRADVVVAADGMGSAVRRRLWSEHPAAGYRRYTTWRALADARGLDLGDAAAETWGRGERFGVVPLPGGRTYVYATAPADAGAVASDPASELADLLRRFGRWHAPIPALLARIQPDDLLRHEVLSLEPPVRRRVRGRVALLGDAAHGMEPNLGQGACLALEDAVTLSALLTELPVTSALDRYSAARAVRVTPLSRQSRVLGLATSTRSRALTALRDAAVLCAPDAVSLRGFDGAAGWRPPALTPDTARTPETALDRAGRDESPLSR